MSKSNYMQIMKHIEGQRSFTGNTMTGERREFGFGIIYQVWSYNEPILAVVSDIAGGKVSIFRNDRKYSVTTSKHQTYVRRALASFHYGMVTHGYDVETVTTYDYDAIDKAIREAREAWDKTPKMFVTA
jgi:hypothetical protein